MRLDFSREGGSRRWVLSFLFWGSIRAVGVVGRFLFRFREYKFRGRVRRRREDGLVDREGGRGLAGLLVGDVGVLRVV